jgi:hypothetical protein
VDDASDAAATVGEPLDFDNFEPWPSVDVPLTLTVGVAGVTSITVVGTAIQILGPSTAFLQSGPRWLGGTLITLDGQSTYTLWNRPTPIAGGLQMRTVENMGAPSPTTVFIEEPIVANQPNPFLVGPDSFGVIYAMGDPLRPGFVSVSKQYAPDMTANNVLDLTPPSEPMMGGQVIDGITALASSARWWQLQQPGFTTATQWLKVEIPAGRGLAAPYGHCTDGKFIYFWANDGIYAMIMGFPAQSLTDADIGNIFPHDGIAGQDITYNGSTVYAPAYRCSEEFRLTIANNMLRAHYVDSNDNRRTLIFDMSLGSDGNARNAWSVENYNDPITISHEPEQPLDDCGPTCTNFTLGGGAVAMKARVAIELLDYGIGSNGTPTDTTFKRSSFRLDMTMYPPGTSFTFETTYYNNTGSNQVAYILDSTNTIVQTLTFPNSGSITITRYSGFANTWTPASDTYRIKIPGIAGVDNQLSIYTLRLVADPQGTVGTVEIPLTSYFGRTALDQTAGGGDIFRTTSTTFVECGQPGSLWTYHAAEWATITNVRFSAVLAYEQVFAETAGAVLQLWDLTALAEVTHVTVNTPGFESPLYADIDIAPASLTDGHQYTIRLKSLDTVFAANAFLHKSRLVLQMNPWNRSLIMLRVDKGQGSSVDVEARMITPAGASYPAWSGTVIAEFIGLTGTPGTKSYVYDASAADSGTAGSNITGANVTQAASKSLQRTADFSANYTANHRIMGNNDIAGVTLTQTFLIFPLVRI